MPSRGLWKVDKEAFHCWGSYGKYCLMWQNVVITMSYMPIDVRNGTQCTCQVLLCVHCTHTHTHPVWLWCVGEEGQDAGGLLREWYLIMSREIFNPMYALFMTSPGDRVTYTINPSSHCNSNHLSYYKFVGRVMAKAIYDNKLLECYFTRSFYKHILGVPVK